MIHCYQATDGEYVAHLDREPFFDHCPLRAIWLALKYELEAKWPTPPAQTYSA